MNKWDMAKLKHYYCLLKLIVNKTCGLMTKIEHHKTQSPEFENQLNAICKDKPYSQICIGAITYL